jgi:hypothetical protein
MSKHKTDLPLEIEELIEKRDEVDEFDDHKREEYQQSERRR